MSEPTEITPLHVELPTPKYEALKLKAKAGHRSLKGEILRLMEVVYGNDDAIASQNKHEPAAQQAGAA